MAQEVLIIQDINQSLPLQKVIKKLINNLIERAPSWIGHSLVSILATCVSFNFTNQLVLWILELFESHDFLLEADESRFVLMFLWSLIVQVNKDGIHQSGDLLDHIVAICAAIFKNGSQKHLLTDYIGMVEDIKSSGLSVTNLQLEFYVNERRKRLVKLFTPLKPFIMVPGYSHPHEYVNLEHFSTCSLFSNVSNFSEIFDQASQVRRLIIWGGNLDQLKLSIPKVLLNENVILNTFMDLVRLTFFQMDEKETSTDFTLDSLFATLDQLKSFNASDIMFWRKWMAVSDRVFALCSENLIDLSGLVNAFHKKACISGELHRDNILLWLILQVLIDQEGGYATLMKDIEGDEIIFRKLSHIWCDRPKDATHVKLLRDITFPVFCSRFGQNLKDRATLPIRHPATKTMLPMFHQIRTTRELLVQPAAQITKGIFSISSKALRPTSFIFAPKI